MKSMDALSYFAIILVLGIVAQWVSWRHQLPSILLLLAFGFGLSLTTGVKIDDFIQEDTLLSIVGIFVAIILFEGGMTLKFSELKEAGTPVFRLCTYTVIIGFVLTFYFMKSFLGYAWPIAALLGAILTVTGPTVVAPLLRVIKPSKKISSIVKWEGIVVDPIGAILALLVFEVAIHSSSGQGSGFVFGMIFNLLLSGVLFPYLLARGVLWMMKKHLIPDFLHSVFLLAVVAGAFAAANALQAESGLLTVTVLGIALANQKSVSVRHIIEFKENLQVLIISMLFIMLSGRIEWGAMKEVFGSGLALIAVLIVVIRPLAVYLGMLNSKKTTLREKTFLAFLAPRGIVAAAVTSVFALEFEHAADEGKLPHAIAEQAHQLVPLVFMCIIGTVLVYGLLALPLAKKLKVTSSRTDGVLFAGAEKWIIEIARFLKDDGFNVLLLDTKYEKILEANEVGVPAIRANILSEYAEHEIDFGGIGQLIAATPNDEINSLACLEYVHSFGRKNVWQVAPEDHGVHHSKAVSVHKRARICFGHGLTIREMGAFFDKPHRLIKRTITEDYNIIQFYREYGKNTVVLFLMDEKDGLRPAPSNFNQVFGETTLYAVVEDQPEDAVAQQSAPMGL